ncbi:hypothetical protein CEXT_152921, partial [Caerostris extrusa]
MNSIRQSLLGKCSRKIEVCAEKDVLYDSDKQLRDSGFIE